MSTTRASGCERPAWPWRRYSARHGQRCSSRVPRARACGLGRSLEHLSLPDASRSGSAFGRAARGPFCPGATYGHENEMFDTRELRMISAWSIGLGALLVFALVSCGGSGTKHDHTAAQPPPTQLSTTTARLPAQIPSAGAVPITPTPRAALARCRQSKLLRPICPQRIPLSLHSAAYDLADGCANAPHITIASRRCTLPGWSYESSAPLPGVPTKGSEQVSAWDGTEWFVPSYSPRTPPPYLVHVDIGAAAGPAAVMVADLGRPQHVDRVTDALREPRPRAPGGLLRAGPVVRAARRAAASRWRRQRRRRGGGPRHLRVHSRRHWL